MVKKKGECQWGKKKKHVLEKGVEWLRRLGALLGRSTFSPFSLFLKINKQNQNFINIKIIGIGIRYAYVYAHLKQIVELVYRYFTP